MKTVSGVLALLLAFTAARALAGVVDSPLPASFTQHVFTVPGVLNISGFETYFACTNLDKASVTIGVELFTTQVGPTNDATATSLTVAVGETVLFATGAGPTFNISPSSFLGSLGGNKGAARILATSKKIACNAFVTESNNVPPTSGWHLTIIAKTKQKAAN